MADDCDHISVSRTAGFDVPLLRDVPTDARAVDVLGVEARAGGGRGSPSAGVASAAAAVLSAVSGLPAAASMRLFLIASSWPGRPPNRLAAMMAQRNRLWRQWESDAVAVPRGRRHDFPVLRDDDKVQFAGWIDCGLDELGAAVEVTRTRPALCVLHPESDVWSRRVGEMLRGLGDRASDRGDLLRAFLPAAEDGAILLRGFASSMTMSRVSTCMRALGRLMRWRGC